MLPVGEIMVWEQPVPHVPLLWAATVPQALRHLFVSIVLEVPLFIITSCCSFPLVE